MDVDFIKIGETWFNVNQIVYIQPGHGGKAVIITTRGPLDASEDIDTIVTRLQDAGYEG